jgi:hypothetical protein
LARPAAALALAFLLLLLLAPLALYQVQAQETPPASRRVQVVRGEITPGGHGQVFILKGLKKGDVVYIAVDGLTGNLDPWAGLVSGVTDMLAINRAFGEAINQAFAEGRDPLTVLPAFADAQFLAWDDDSGPGYSVRFSYTVPRTGDYKLLVTTNPARRTWGEFQLVVGVNAPEVLTGKATPTGDDFVRKVNVFPPLQAMQEMTGTVTPSAPRQRFTLRPLKAGDVVYAYAQPLTSTLPMYIRLVDFGDKPLAVGYDSDEEQRSITLTYQVQEDVTHYVIEVVPLTDDAEGTYRLLVGINMPETLTGELQPTEETVLQEPIRVKIGVKMDQITGVDQKAENFGIVNTLQMEWQDPKLAFDPATCNCKYKSLSIGDFTKYVASHGTIWPEFVYFNQQGRRDIQNGMVVVFSDGQAIYYERSTVTLQAPDFDFRLYPFDMQTFYIRIRQVFPDHLFVFTNLPDFSGTGKQLGEEEWVIQDQWTEINAVDTNSQYSFAFTANRHLMYYVVRIFIPVLLIIIVSWFTFFLKDYGKRVDVASANLLIFVAFNFTISDALPHLGYATVLDLVLVTTFVITGVVVIFNVWLKRLEVTKKESIAQTIDNYSIWLYPLIYFAAFAVVWFFFTRGGVK